MDLKILTVPSMGFGDLPRMNPATITENKRAITYGFLGTKCGDF